MTRNSFLRGSALAILAATSLSTAALADGPTLEIRNFIGTINASQSAGNITVKGDKKGTVSTSSKTTLIDGDETIDNSRCRNMNGKVSLSFGKKNFGWISGGYKDLSEYPSLKITVPADTTVIVRDSVIFGSLPDLGAADIHVSSCGDLDIGDISGPLDAKISGSGDLAVGDVAGASTIRVSGSGDLKAGDLTDLDIRITGSGDADLGTITMNKREVAMIRVSGSGDIETGAVRGATDIRISGSGDGLIDSVTGDMIFESNGSGDLTLDSIEGARLSIRTTGSGNVDIDDGSIGDLLVNAGGSSSVELGIIAKDASIKARGSSDVDIDDVTGERDISRSGSSYVRIDNTKYDD